MGKRIKYTYEKLMEPGDSIDDQLLKIKNLDFYLEIIEKNQKPDLTDDEKRWVFDSILFNNKYSGILSNSQYFESKVHYLKIPYFHDQYFVFLYLQCDYVKNLNGDKIMNHGYFNNPFNKLEHENNLKLLNEFYLNFEDQLKVNNHSEQLLKRIAEEAREIIKLEFGNAEIHSFGANWRASKRKQLVLFYKYYYIRGKELFNNYDSFKIMFNETEVIFDFESYVHCSRHFAKMIKPDLLNKSYFRQDFKPLEIHKLLTTVFKEIGNKLTITIGDNTGIFLELNKIVYKLYINLKSNDVGKKVLKIMSLFPVEDLVEKRKYELLEKNKINENLFIFQ